MPIEILVASGNPDKIGAAQDAADYVFGPGKAHVFNVEAGSGINPQPFGYDETRLGAVNRVRNALRKTATTYDIALSFESGIFPETSENDTTSYIDKTVIVAEGVEGTLFETVVDGVAFPADVVEALKLRISSGEETTIKPLLNEMMPETRGHDLYAYFTNGRKTRRSVMAEGATALLLRFKTLNQPSA